MATGKKKLGISLGVGTFLVTGLLILLTVGAAAAVTWVLGQRSAEAAAAEELRGSHATHTVLQQQRYRQLLLISRIFATEEILTSYLAQAAEEGDRVAVLDSIEEYQNLLSFDLAMVLDRNGRLLTRTDDPDAAGDDLSTNPLVAVALEEEEAFGVLREESKLYHAVALPLVRQFDLVGYIVVAFAVNDTLALQIERASGAQTAFLASTATGPVVAASTLDSGLIAALPSALRVQGEGLNRVTQRGETAERVELEIEGRRWLAFMAPLRDAAGQTVGATVALSSLDARFADYQRVLTVVLGVGAAALVLGVLLSWLLARGSGRTVRLLASAAEQAARGRIDVALPPAGAGDPGRLTEALRGLLRGLREKLALEYFAGRVARFLPEPAKGGGAQRPRAREVALVAVEMRRFANPKVGYDPEENLGRYSRDLRRISTAAEPRNGRVEAVHGHRVLVVFEGEGCVFQGFAAATEILLVLSERENVFDEPEPPVVALTHGTVISGSVVLGDQPCDAVAGLPVQQLESLVREATPGEVFFSKATGEVLVKAFHRAGVKVQGKRGLLSPQPLFSLTAELAAKTTGVTAPETAAAGFPDEGRNLAEIQPGVTLGSRFDVLAELGTGRMGRVCKARDRELGDLVTLKLLKPEVLADQAQFEWLRSVIQRARAIRHPNLLGVLDFGEAEGIAYISCEFERGMTLRYVLSQSRQVPVIAGVRLARQLGYGLSALHGENLLHRAVKPENVLLETAGNARLMDFALSLPTHAGGTILGAQYMAPEQLEGREGTPAADVFSLGVVLYEAFTGKVPFAGQNPTEVRNQQLSADPEPPSTLCEMPGELERILLRCLAKTPDGRYPSVGDFLADLDAVPV